MSTNSATTMDSKNLSRVGKIVLEVDQKTLVLLRVQISVEVVRLVAPEEVRELIPSSSIE